jgi:hypothetical protein
MADAASSRLGDLTDNDLQEWWLDISTDSIWALVPVHFSLSPARDVPFLILASGIVVAVLEGT